MKSCKSAQLGLPSQETSVTHPIPCSLIPIPRQHFYYHPSSFGFSSAYLRFQQWSARFEVGEGLGQRSFQEIDVFEWNVE